MYTKRPPYRPLPSPPEVGDRVCYWGNDKGNRPLSYGSGIIEMIREDMVYVRLDSTQTLRVFPFSQVGAP